MCACVGERRLSSTLNALSSVAKLSFGMAMSMSSSSVGSGANNGVIGTGNLPTSATTDTLISPKSNRRHITCPSSLANQNHSPLLGGENQYYCGGENQYHRSASAPEATQTSANQNHRTVYRECSNGPINTSGVEIVVDPSSGCSATLDAVDSSTVIGEEHDADKTEASGHLLRTSTAVNYPFVINTDDEDNDDDMCNGDVTRQHHNDNHNDTARDGVRENVRSRSNHQQQQGNKTKYYLTSYC